MSINVKRIIEILILNEIKFIYNGNESLDLIGFSNIKNIKKSTICYSEKPISINDQTILLLTSDTDCCCNSITVQDPKMVFYFLSNLIKFENNFIDRSIDPSCELGKNVVIGHSRIGKNVKIGHNVVIGDGVTIGEGTIIDSNSSIGCSGISWTWKGEEKIFLNAYGNTIIGSGCIISSNVKIVRGIFTNDTILGDKVFIAPGSAIGHSTIIEEQVHIANNCTIGGSCFVGQNSFLGCGSTIASGAKLKKNVVLGAGCVVIPDQDLDSNSVYVGIPAKKIKTIGNHYALKSIPKKEKK